MLQKKGNAQKNLIRTALNTQKTIRLQVITSLRVILSLSLDAGNGMFFVFSLTLGPQVNTKAYLHNQ